MSARCFTSLGGFNRVRLTKTTPAVARFPNRGDMIDVYTEL